LLAVAETESCAGQANDAGRARADHFQLGSTAETKLLQPTDLLNSPDDLPHDGGLAASQHIERNHVGHLNHFGRWQLKLRLSINNVM
jgi:hypothetical protein